MGWKTNKVQAEQAKRLLSEGLKRAEEVAEVLQAMSGKVERKGREQEDSQLGRWMAKEVERTGEVTMSLQHFMETLQR